MALANVYYEGAVDINGTVLRGVFNLNETLNPDLIRRAHAGNLYNIHSVVGQLAPVITFDTVEVETALGVIGVGGVVVTTSVAYWAQSGEVARSGAGNHVSATVNDGIIVPRTITWNGGTENCVLSCEIICTSPGGSTAPIVRADNANLPATAIIPETFTGCKIDFNTTELDCVQNFTLDFGLDVFTGHHKGLAYPVRAFVRSARPTLTVTNLDPTDGTTYGPDGTRLTAATVFLRKDNITDGEAPTRYPDVDVPSRHLKFAMVDGIVHPGATAGGDNEATQELIAVFDENASTAAIVMTTAQDIA